MKTEKNNNIQDGRRPKTPSAPSNHKIFYLLHQLVDLVIHLLWINCTFKLLHNYYFFFWFIFSFNWGSTRRKVHLLQVRYLLISCFLLWGKPLYCMLQCVKLQGHQWIQVEGKINTTHSIIKVYVLFGFLHYLFKFLIYLINAKYI